MRRVSATILIFCVLGRGEFTLAQEPDREFARVGKWQIATARWGIGCVASQVMPGFPQVTIGGDKASSLSLRIGLQHGSFSTNILEGVDQVELVIGEKRWGGTSGLTADDYRGTDYLVLKIDEAVRNSLSQEPSIKITDRGTLKFRIAMNDVAPMFKALATCFRETR